MTALDVCEAEIIRALEKDGWHIAEKPFTIRVNKQTVYADFSVQKHTGETVEEVVVLEVKCFTNPKNDLSEFYTAVGQYQFYRAAMMLSQLLFPLYLAVPDTAFVRLDKNPSVREVLKDAGLRLVVIDTDKEEVLRWIS